ncbi:hypothetical protein F5Y15DRAFT_164874 [Xylariaceae sp. FL0016]|nr:hypothetical protein F5Y15DRAFT_164874 [Xylariaceae sp. FL0016]
MVICREAQRNTDRTRARKPRNRGYVSVTSAPSRRTRRSTIGFDLEYYFARTSCNPKFSLPRVANDRCHASVASSRSPFVLSPKARAEEWIEGWVARLYRSLHHANFVLSEPPNTRTFHSIYKFPSLASQVLSCEAGRTLSRWTAVLPGIWWRCNCHRRLGILHHNVKCLRRREGELHFGVQVDARTDLSNAGDRVVSDYRRFVPKSRPNRDKRC